MPQKCAQNTPVFESVGAPARPRPGRLSRRARPSVGADGDALACRGVSARARTQPVQMSEASGDGRRSLEPALTSQHRRGCEEAHLRSFIVFFFSSFSFIFKMRNNEQNVLRIATCRLTHVHRPIANTESAHTRVTLFRLRLRPSCPMLTDDLQE